MISKNLFICCTPLQCHIAQLIIENRKLVKNDCVLIFYNSLKSESLIFNYNKYKIDYFESYYYHVQDNFPFNVYHLKKILINKVYKNIFFASIDSIYVQYILSKISYENLFTFDDGTANISENGHYALNKTSFFKTIIYKLFFYKILGRFYINSQSVAHYTIFKYFKNYVGNFYLYIELSKKSKYLEYSKIYKDNNKKSNCRILLGTVENEALFKLKKSIIIEKYKKLKKLESSELYYIKHPRGQINYVDCNLPILNNNNYSVGELIILEALENYDKITIFGFSSTIQLNLMNNKKIEIVLFESKYESNLIRDVRNKIKNYSNVKITNFDLL